MSDPRRVRVEARDLREGDVLCSFYGTDRRVVRALRPVGPDAGRHAQVTVESEHPQTHALYSDTVYLDSTVLVLRDAT